MSTLFDAIRDGEYDHQLDLLTAAVKARKDALVTPAWQYTKGQPVKYVPEVRPKYLAGATGKIEKINRTKVVVRLDQPVGRFRGLITTPTSLIEAV